MASDVRETVFLHFDDYHTKAIQLRGQYLSEYFPPVVRWPARVNRRVFASFVVALIGVGFAASFGPQPSETAPMSTVNPNDLTVDPNLKDGGILDTF
jgi:hypothetical protein